MPKTFLVTLTEKQIEALLTAADFYLPRCGMPIRFSDLDSARVQLIKALPVPIPDPVDPKKTSDTLLPGEKQLTKENLIELRNSMRPIGSGPLGVMKIAFRLCNIIAGLQGWTFDD